MSISSSAHVMKMSSSEIVEEEEGSSSTISGDHQELFEIKNSNSSTSKSGGPGGNGIHTRNPNRGLELDTIIREEIVVVEAEGSSLFSFDFNDCVNSSCDQEDNNDAVYVAVIGNNYQGSGSEESSSSSMDALLWTLNHAVVNPSSTTVFLVHVFPEIKHIPTPLGMMAVSQVNPEQKDKYMGEEREKRRGFLNKFLNACSAAKIKADTILIESDMEARAILDLIPILNITKLVMGISKSNLRKMMRSTTRRGGGGGGGGSSGSGIVVDQILKAAPHELCDVKIICDGKEVLDDLIITHSPSPSPLPHYNQSTTSTSSAHNQHQPTTTTDSFTCGCFKPRVHS